MKRRRDVGPLAPRPGTPEKPGSGDDGAAGPEVADRSPVLTSHAPAASAGRLSNAVVPATETFFDLTPERVLAAVEAAGLVPTGLCYTLNSYENRVYEIELDEASASASAASRTASGATAAPVSAARAAASAAAETSRRERRPTGAFPTARPNAGAPAAPGQAANRAAPAPQQAAATAVERTRVVAKFYRPGRWQAAQILEEHQFIAELAAAEIPVCTVRPFPDGSTLRAIEGIFYSLADRFGGRAPDELDEGLAERLGMLAGRLHNVGAAHAAEHRWRLDADRFVREPLAWLAAHGNVPPRLWRRYESAATTIAEAADRVLPTLPIHRIHGDLHRGNLLLRDGKLSLLDFDDMAMGPAVQDLWLALPGRDRDSERLHAAFLAGYRRFRVFEDAWLAAIEPLRGLRLVHYAVWLARRADDPAFQRAWPDFGTADWWDQETQDLEAQARAVLGVAPPPPEAPRPAHAALDGDPSELSNKDYFWDWEG